MGSEYLLDVSIETKEQISLARIQEMNTDHGYIHYGNTGCGVFKRGGTKLERFLHKNQHTKRKSLNFEFWINDMLSKIGHHSSNKKKICQKMSITKNALLK